MALAPALTQQETQFLKESSSSEHYRVYKKAIEHYYSVVCARLASAEASELLRIQGVLQGLLAAVNILQIHSLTPSEKDLRDTPHRMARSASLAKKSHTPHNAS